MSKFLFIISKNFDKMSLVLTRTQNIRANSNLDKNEIRGSRWGALDKFLIDSQGSMSIISEEMRNKYATSIGSTFEIPVIKYDGGISIGSSRSVTVSDSENTSALQPITSTVYSWGFTMVPSLYHNNEIGYQKDFEKKFWKYAYLFLNTLDSACVTSLNTNRTQVWADPLSYGDPTASDFVDVDLDKELRVLSEIDVMMEANDYFGQIGLIGNGGLQSVYNRTLQHGRFNDENKALALGGKTLHYTTRISNDTGYGATFYAVNEGSLGILSRVDREALARRKTNLSYEWDVINFPILGLPVGTMYYESVGDFNAIAGAATADMTASYKEHFGFSVDVAIFTAYNSAIATLANPIMKFAIKNA